MSLEIGKTAIHLAAQAAIYTSVKKQAGASESNSPAGTRTAYRRDDDE